MSHSNEFWNFGNADRSEDTPKGYFTPLFPHNLGRPLHHPEQDYNAHLISQIVKGFRVIGSGDDGVMTTDDLEMGIKLHEIDPSDADYLHYIACGCKDEEWIWVPAEMGGITVSPFNVTAYATDINPCNNSSNAVINAQGTGGTTPYLYSLQTSPNVNPGNITDWITFPPFNDYNGILLDSSTDYYVYGKDAVNTIDIVGPININTIDLPTLTISSTGTTQPNGTDGTITVNVSGGVGGYTYVLYQGNDPENPGPVVVDVNGNNYYGVTASTEYTFGNPNWLISAGDYVIRVNDASTGCSVQGTVTVSQPEALSFTPILRNATCLDANHGSDPFAQDGFEFSLPVGGTAPYEYSITDPATTGYTWVTDTVFDVGSGDVTVYPAMRDATGYIYYPGAMLFYNPEELNYNVTPVDVDCASGMGSITFSNMTGGPVANHWPGTPEWQVSIDGGLSWSPPSGTTIVPFTLLVPVGVYSTNIRRVLTEPNGNFITACPSAPIDPVFVNGAAGVDLDQVATTDDAICGTGADGEFIITGITVGGQNTGLDYTVEWTLADESTVVGSQIGSSTDITISNINTGTYDIYIIDNIGGCLKLEEDVTIASIASNLVLNVTAADICSNSITNIGYEFESGSGTVNIYDTAEYANDPVNATPLVTSNNADETGTFSPSYGIGTYSFTAIDGTACEVVATVTINEIADPTITLNPTDPTCGADGQIEAIVSNATISGGADPILELEDSLGNITTSIPVNTFGNTVYFPNIIGGTYIVRIINDECLSGASETVTLTPAVAPIITAATTDVSCNGLNNGSAIINITGGQPDYTIEVEAPNGSTQTYTGDSPISIPAALVPGTYTIDGVDDNGCVFNGSFDITEPNAFIVDGVQIITGACWIPTSSGVQISFSGGTLDYSAAIFDLNNTQIGPVQTGIGATSFTFLDDSTYSLPTGFYYIIGTDANGCTVQSDQFEIPPCTFAATFDSVTNSEIDCHQGVGDIITVVSGGSGNYEFSLDGTTWDGPYSPANAGDPYPYTFTDPTFIGGTTHNVYVRDSDDPTSPADMVSYTLIDPDAIAVTTNPSTPESVSGAADGEVSFSDIIGGTQPYATLALFDSTQTQIDIVNLPVPSTTYTFGNLEAGTYYIIITDDNGCESDKIYSTIADGSAPLTFSSSLGEITCFGGTTNVDVTVFGGSGTFRFSNDGGNSWTAYLNQTTYTFTGMAAGPHTIVVEDEQSYPGNPMSDAINLNQPSLVQTQAGWTDETIVGEEDGTITLQTSGGTPDYTISLYGADGFTDTITGTPGQTLFQWNNLVAQSYTYITEDSNGCGSGSNITISPGVPQVNATVNAGTILCPNGTTDVIMTTSDGSGDYQYGINPTNSASNPSSNWTATTQDATYTWTSGAGSWYYWVRDAVTGTEKWVNETITDPDGINVSYNGAETYPGADDASIQIFINGGTPTYTAKCIETNELLTNLQEEAPGVPSGTFTTITEAGIYTIEITDANGCQEQSILTVTTIFDNISIDSVTSTPTCFGETDGIISFTASGGFGSTYEWSKDGGNTWTQDITFFDNLVGADYDIFLRDYNTGETLEWSSNPVTVVEADEIQVLNDKMTDGTCSEYPEYYIKFTGSNLTSNIAANQSVTLEWSLGNNGGANSTTADITNITSLGNNEFEGSLSFELLTSVNNNGTFSVKVTSDGCEKDHGSISYTSLDDVVLTVTPVSQPECPNDVWTYEATATGGTNTTYKLMTAPSTVITTWDGSLLQFTLPQTVISDNTAILAQDIDYVDNGCQSTASVVDTREVSELVVSGSVDNPNCATSGGSTYSFTITGGFSGGTANNTYKYKVSTDGGSTYSGTVYDYTGAVGPVGITDGDLYIKAYRIVNTNSTEGNCDVAEGLGIVTNPVAISGSIDSGNTSGPTACSGPDATNGQIAMNVTGGTGTYEFSYDGGNTWYTLTETLPGSGAYKFTGLSAGTYSIVARDVPNACEAFTDTVILSAPNSPVVQSHKIEGCWRDADGASVRTEVFVANNGTSNSAGLYTFTDNTADAPTTNTTGVFTYSNSDMTTHVQAPITITEISTQCSYVMNSFNFTAVPSLTSNGVIDNFNNTPSGNPTGTYDTDDFKVWNIGSGGNVGYGGPYTVELIDNSGNVYGTINNATTGNNYIYDVPSGDYTYKIYDNSGLTGCGRTYNTPMTSTQQVLNEETFYHFHMGGSVAPYGDLIPTNTTWYDSTGTVVPNTSSGFNTIMTDMIDNGDGTMQPSGVTMPTTEQFEFAGPIDGQQGCNPQWTHTVTGGNDYYYLAVPDNSAFNVNLVTAGFLQFNCAGTYNASSRRAFVYDGENYWLYKMQNPTGNTALTYGFK